MFAAPVVIFVGLGTWWLVGLFGEEEKKDQKVACHYRVRKVIQRPRIATPNKCDMLRLRGTLKPHSLNYYACTR